MQQKTDHFDSRISVHTALNCIKSGDALAKTIDSNKQDVGTNF
ncbi:hypothetical protein [Legionella lytica]|nr:hypothetical protein [Legionella lytica]